MFQPNCQKVIPWDTPGSIPYSLLCQALDLNQMVMDIRKQSEITVYYAHQLLFQQHYQKVIPWDTPGSIPYSWVSEALDLTQMVMDIRKQLKSAYFIIPNNFSLHNITKKSFPGTPRVNALLLGVRGSGPHPDGH